jgi:hypothetical protein
MSLLGQYEYVIDKSHSRANADGSVYVHMIVAEEKLGRHLLPEEVVHHKDLNKLNNDPNNLMIFASNSDHSRFHANGCNESMLSLNENGVYVCEKREYICIDCGEEITRYGIRCKKCSAIHGRKADRPTSDELFNILLSHNGNFTKVAKEYGVSDNAVRKWCDCYNLPRKSREYKM